MFEGAIQGTALTIDGTAQTSQGAIEATIEEATEGITKGTTL